jgi:hypothetical protein
MPWKAFGGGRAQDKPKRETTSRGNDQSSPKSLGKLFIGHVLQLVR